MFFKEVVKWDKWGRIEMYTVKKLLPKYFSDVLGLSNVVNGMISSLPSIVLFVSKTFSSILASLLTARKPPLLGMHTPGVQTALVQIAPAYSGIVTGIAFAVVA
ncbi:hypothetical protein TELCIR_18929, partial [Teladorsagia circumcincta]